MLKNIRKKLLVTLLMTAILIPVIPAKASWTVDEAIVGWVYINGIPASGIEVHVYNDEGFLEGYGAISGLLGTEYTDSDGKFNITHLEGYGVWYTVEAISSCGISTQSVQVFCDTTTFLWFCCEIAPGTGTPGYWKNHPDAWPVDEIIIGGVTYLKADAINMMWAKKNKDKTYTMFGALVAAKLNVLIGNPDWCIEDTIAAADDWMATYGPVGSGVRGNSDAWKEGEPLYLELDDYNNGLLCAPHRD